MTLYDEPGKKFQLPTDMTLEQAEDIKRETFGEKQAELKRVPASPEREYLAQLQGPQRFYAALKEFFGFGLRFEYKQHMRKLEGADRELDVMSQNCSQVISDYSAVIRESNQEFFDKKRLFALNEVIHSQTMQLLHQRREQYSVLEKQSVLGPTCTTEALSIQRDIADLESKVLAINHENDTVAIGLTVHMHTRDTQMSMYDNLRAMYSRIESQRAAFKSHYQIALANEQLIHGLHGVQFASEVYTKSFEHIQGLQDLQKKLKSTTLDAFAADAKITGPKMPQTSEPGVPYWQTVARELKKRNL